MFSITYGISLESVTKSMGASRSVVSEFIRQALEDGINSFKELCKIGGFKSSEGLQIYCKKYQIELPENLIPYKQRPELDVLIEQGLTLKEIGEKVHLSKERVRQYINLSGQYNEWRKKRGEVDERLGKKRKIKDLRGLLVSALRVRAKQLAENKGWACQKAVEHILLRERHYEDCLISYYRLHKLFKAYETAMEKGKKLSLRELSKKAGISHFTMVSKIFRKVGVNPMYGKKIRTVRSGEKKNAVKRGLKTNFTGPDIAYFLQLPRHLPTLRYNEGGLPHKRYMAITRFGSTRGGELKFLSHRLASQIYEAQDCGFNRKEISELTGTTNEIINYALGHEAKIKPKIVKGLRILYLDKKINKPYVTKEMRERLEKEARKRRRRNK